MTLKEGEFRRESESKNIQSRLEVDTLHLDGGEVPGTQNDM